MDTVELTLFALVIGIVAVCACGSQAQPAEAGMSYTYPHPPDEEGWDGQFQDPQCSKLLDGSAAGGAAYSVIWSATTQDRFIDLDMGEPVALDRIVVKSYKHYTGRDFQFDHVRVYLSETGQDGTWALLGEQQGYKLADEKGIRDFVFELPAEPVRYLRVAIQNDEEIRLALSEIEIYGREQPEIPYNILINFEEIVHEPEGPAPVPKPEDTKAGYVLFAPSYLRRIFPNSVPLAHERVDAVSTFASLGEYEPVTVAVYPLREVGECTLSVSELSGPNGASIAVDDIDIRTVKQWRQIPGQKGADFAKQYMAMPELLEASDTIKLGESSTRQWWISIHVPEEATPGQYTGTIAIKSERGGTRQLELQLRVLPIKLQRPEDYNFGMYWGPWRDGAPSQEQIVAQLRDMREHGMNSVALSAPASMSLGENGEYQFDLTVITQTLELLKQEGLTNPIPWAYNFAPIQTDFGSDLHFEQVKVFVEHAMAHFAERGLPEVLWYPRDEPWHGERKEQARTLCEAIKQVPGARTYITVQFDTAEYLDPWLDVRCHTLSLSGGFEPQEVRQAAADSGDLYWWYTNACREYPDVMRFKGGFFFWKTGTTGQYYWAYQYPSGEPYNDLDGIDWCATYPGEGGPIPTIEWEGLREGIDDFRYAYTLEQTIAKAREQGPDAARKLAAQAEEVLQTIRGDAVIDLHEYDDRGLNFHTDSIWPPEKYDDYRRQIAEMIVRLQEAI